MIKVEGTSVFFSLYLGVCCVYLEFSQTQSKNKDCKCLGSTAQNDSGFEKKKTKGGDSCALRIEEVEEVSSVTGDKRVRQE